MSEDCLFKVVLGKCPHMEKLSRSQPDGARLRNIIDASIRYGDLLHVTLQEKLDSNENTQVYYHRHCISTYLTCAPSTSQSVYVQCPPHKRIRRSDIPVFKFREHCLYCAKICEVENDYKHPKRWVPAYLVKEVDKNELDEMGKPVKAKDKIIAQCKVRADQWGEVVKARVMGSLSDLHASDARYHKDCLSRFSSNRNAQFDSNESHGDCIDETPQLAGVKQLIAEMRSDQTKIWDSAGLQERFVDIVGSPIKRVELVRMLSESADDLVILSAIGYRKIVMFRDNARETLKVTKADDEEEDIDSALDVISKAIKTEVVNIQCEKDTYKRGISKSVASDSVSPTLQVLLQKLTPKLDTDSLTSILVGNMVTSVMRSHATPLQIALGVLVHRKKIIKHLFDYNVTCSYDEMVRYKSLRSSTMARYKKMRREERSPVTVDGLIQHIVDNFDADMSSPNGKISTHALAMIECFPESDNTTENDSFPRISKLEMKNPIHFDDEEDELMPFIGGGNPLPPPTLPSSLSDEFREKQRVSYARAGDMDFEFLQCVVTDETETPEFNGFNTRASRQQGQSPSPKTHVNYLPLIDAKPSDPSTILTSMMKAKRLTNARGQYWVIYTADQQLYKVTCQIIWNNVEQFTSLIPRLGGMHFLMSFIGTVGANAADSGLAEVLESAFAGVTKMLGGKKFPQNLRALRLLTEELLRETLQSAEMQSMHDLQSHLESLSDMSRTAKLWINTIIRPTLIMMKFVRAEGENDFHLHLKAVAEALPYFFSAGHINYARYGVYYLRQMESLPDDVLERFEKGEHTVHLKAGIWNGIWSDMGIETTWMRKGKGPEGIIGSTNQPETIRTFAYSYHDCITLTSDLNEMREDKGEEIQINHKEEAPISITTDGQDRLTIRQKLAICINPLNPDEHPQAGLINIVTGEVILNQEVNVDNALELGQKQQEEFDSAWPDAFYKPLKRAAINMTASRKSIDVGGHKIIDTGVFYARALALHSSQRGGSPSIETMLATELSPIATAMFDDEGHMRATQKSQLKREIAIEKSHRGVMKDSYFLDGCAILWVVAWPSSSNAIVQDYIDAFRSHVRRYQESADVFLTFDRYTNASTKDVTRSARDKGATKVFQMKNTSRLPAAKLLFSVTANKIQVIKYIVADLIEHKDDVVTHSLIVTGPDPVPYELPGGVVIRRRDLVTTQEEADTIIIQQVADRQVKDGGARVIIADDTDVFALLVYFKYAGSLGNSPIYMESPIRQRGVIDIDATVNANPLIIPNLLTAHALSGCDTVASYFGIGKGKALKVLRSGAVAFDLLGDPTLPMTSYDMVTEEAARFVIACYNLTGKTTMTEARIAAWKIKMRKSSLEPPKLCSLPPTSAAFHQNALRAHYQVAVWRNALEPNPPSLDPTDHGWSRQEGTTKLVPTIVPCDNPLAPVELLKVIKCGCESSSPCSTNRCGCKSQHLACTLFCVCKGGDICRNDIEPFRSN